MSAPANDLVARLAERVKQLLLDEEATNVVVDPNVEVQRGDSVFIGGDVGDIPVSVYVNVVPQ